MKGGRWKWAVFLSNKYFMLKKKEKKEGASSRAESSCFSSSALLDWEQSYKFGCPPVLFATSLVTTPGKAFPVLPLGAVALHRNI